MEYYSVLDALAEGALVRVELKADAGSKHMQEMLKGRHIEDKKVFLPYHAAECLVGTEHVEAEPVVAAEQEAEMEGAPEFCQLEHATLYALVEKAAGTALVQEGTKETVRRMHRKRAVRGANELGGEGERGLEREEAEILRKGRAGWRAR